MLGSTVSFEITESKTKRRHLPKSPDKQEFRPLYEEVYDGNLQINWQISYYNYAFDSRYSSSNKEKASSFVFSDSKDSPLENHVSRMILVVYEQFCENEILRTVNSKKYQQEYELEKKARLAEEEAQNQRRIQEEKQTREKSIISGIFEQSNNWFKHKQLIRYADDLKEYLTTCTDEEASRLLQAYIQLVKANADKLNPLDDIINTMKDIES